MPGQLEARVFCMKADYAEATGTHNTQNANYAETLYYTKVPAQEDYDGVRTTIAGFPCVIFHKKDSTSTPEFIGKYNFNFDKGAENVFGFTDEYPNVECWEFCNNTSDACLFHGEIPDSWGDDFEARYPDGCKDISKFKVMHDWVVSTWQDGATGTALASSVTYNGKTYTNDTAEYRLAKFGAEFDDHFNLDFCLMYYVYTFVMLMVDQRAKNMFLTTWDGVHFLPYLYDNDTCLGINNEGEMVFDYYHEDTDIVGEKKVYNGQDSALWVNFRETYPDEIQELYQKLRSDKKLTYDKIVENFVTNGSDKWSISIYNEDADYKYISMLRSDDDSTYLYQVRGTGEEHLRYFVDNRLKYCDSKWYAAEYAENYATLRIYTPSTWSGVAPNADITITPYSNLYAGVRYKANGTLEQKRATKNVAVTFEAPDETFNDTETAIYGASEISSLGDLAPLYCGTINVTKATKLTELKIGDSASGYSNGNLTSLSVGTNKLLKKIDVRNCPALTDPLALSGCPSIEEIYATGSGITGVELPASGYLKTMHLPNTITNLTVRNQPYISDFQCAGYENLTTLRIENCPSLPLSDIVTAATNLNRVRLLGVNLTLSDSSVLDILAACGGKDENDNNLDYPVVTGTAHISSIRQSQLDYYHEKLPDLVITYDEYAAEFSVTFQNWDGEVLDVQYVVSGGSAVEPIEAGRISTPVKEGDAQYYYIFDRWNGTYTNVLSNKVIVAAFSQHIHQYTVRFYNGTILLQTTTVDYGSIVTYSGAIPTYQGTEEGAFVFSGWSDDFTFITHDMDVYAEFVDIASPDMEPIPFSDCSWTLIKAVADNGEQDGDGNWCLGGKVWWSLGDTKDILMLDGNTVGVRLIGFEHDDLVSGGKAPLTIEAYSTTYPAIEFVETRYSSISSTFHSWIDEPVYNEERSITARMYLRETVYNALPHDLQSLIVDVMKTFVKSIEAVEGTNVYAFTYDRCADTLFILSLSEIGLTFDALYYAEDAEGVKYPIYSDDNSRIKYSKNSGAALAYWTRTQSLYQDDYKANVNIYGKLSSERQGNSRYFYFAFCI